MAEIKELEPAIPNHQLAFFLKELMGDKEYEKYKKENLELESIEVPELEKTTPEKQAEKVVSSNPKPKKLKAKTPEDKVERLSSVIDAVVGEMIDAVSRKKLIESFSGVPQKVQNRVIYFCEYLYGSRKTLPNVLDIAVRVLLKDGYISMSNKMAERGNLFQKLLDYPYAEKSALAMGTNTIKAMKFLEIIVEDKTKKLVPNPSSERLEMLKIKMGL